MKNKIFTNSNFACTHAIASMLLLSSCGGDGVFSENNVAQDDCTPTFTPSTTLELEVDSNGNITQVPVSNGTFSGCGSTAGLIEPIIPSSSFETRFENSEDFDVWNCIGSDGKSLNYALLSRDFGHSLRGRNYGFGFDPDAEDLAASQQLFAWRTPKSVNGDLIELRTYDRIDTIPTNSIDIEWTNLRLATEDDFSFTSSVTGSMQCSRATSNIDINVVQFDLKCEHRGPMSACGSSVNQSFNKSEN